MEGTRRWKNVSFSTILWAFAVTMLCALPCFATINVPLPNGETTLNVDYPIVDSVNVNSGGTLNLMYEGEISGDVFAANLSIVNITGGGVGGWIIAYPSANVTVFGTGFSITNGTIDPSGTYFTPNPSQQCLLKGTYGGGAGSINLTFYVYTSGIQISLADPGSPPEENNPPVPDAGPDLTVFTKDIASTVIDSLATDPDAEDSLQYRWVEGSVAFTLWAPVGANGEAPLNLETIDPLYLGIGPHTLTLEVSDGKETVSDEMVLTIEIASLTIDIKPGSYPNSINLGSHGVVPVAILSTSEFNATTLKAENIFLAGSGVRVRGKGNKYLASEEDVNGDGLLDLVVKVETENLDPGTFQDGWACLRVHESSDQTSTVLYEGWDEINIVPPE